MPQELSEQEELALARKVLAKAIEIHEVPDITEEIRLRLIALAANNQQENQKIITRLGPSDNSNSGTQNHPAANVPLLANPVCRFQFVTSSAKRNGSNSCC